MKQRSSFRENLPALCLSIIVLIFLFSCKKETVKGNGTSPGSFQASPFSLNARPIGLSPHFKGFYEYLPEGYSTDAAGTKYPLLIFFHGGGEIGSDSASLFQVLKHGPLKHVKSGSFSTRFTVNGRSYKFIILAPQFTSAEDSYPDEVDMIIEYAKRNYKVDPSRIYLTGLSVGGGICWNYVGKNSNYSKKIAAMVSTAAYINESRNEFKIDAGKGQHIASSNLPIWSTHNSGDNICPLSWITNAHALLKNSNPAFSPSPKLTLFNASIHEGWTRTYDPSFKENNLNIYEWLLQYQR